MLPYGPVYVSTGVETNCRALQQHLVVLHALTTTLASFNNFVFLVNYFQTLVVLIYFALHNGPHTNYHVSTGQIVELLRDIEMQCLMNYLLKVAILKYLLDVRTIISTSGTSLNI